MHGNQNWRPRQALWMRGCDHPLLREGRATAEASAKPQSCIGLSRRPSNARISLDMTLSEIRILLGLRDNPAQDCGDVNALLDAHIRQTEDRVEALLQLKRHLLSLREKCSGARRIEACGILQGLSDCNHPGCNA